MVFAPLLSSLVNRKRYPVAFLPFQGVVVVGLFLLCGNGGTLTFGLGEALALLSSVALAGALVFGERGLENLDVCTVAGTQIAATLVISLAFAWWRSRWSTLPPSRRLRGAPSRFWRLPQRA